MMSLGQMFFKQSAVFILAHNELSILTRYLLNPWFYGAISFFAISTFTWVKILTIMKLSVAYPLLSISYILTAFGAFFIFGEKLTPLNIGGTFLIMLGVSLVSIK